MREDLETEIRMLKYKLKILEADYHDKLVKLCAITNDRDYHMQQLQIFLDKDIKNET